LGGYVKFAGDAGAASNPDVEKLEEIRAAYEADPSLPDVENVFHFRPVWQRALVVLAGPVANFILAILLFAGIGSWVGTQYFPSNIGTVVAGSPAEGAGFKSGDKILELDGNAARKFSYVQQYVMLRKNTEIEARIERGGQNLVLKVTPESKETEDPFGVKTEIGSIGLGLAKDAKLIRETFGVIGSLNYGVSETGNVLKATGTYLGRLFTLKEDGKQLGSIVKIAAVTGKTAVITAKEDLSISNRLKLWSLRMMSL